MKCKKLGAALALASTLGFVTALVAPAPAEAIPPCGWHAKYYSDSSQTTVIGRRWVTIESCGCELDGWGYAAGWMVVIDQPICSFE